MLHRHQLANDLLSLAELLEKQGINTGEIRKAVSQLKDANAVPKIDDSDKVDYTYYGYDIGNIEFYFDKSPAHTHPDDLDPLTLKFDINLIAKYNEEQDYSDPLKHLEFNILVIGFKNQTEHIISYHLDRHPEGENHPIEAHPKYHFQFGGRKLKKANKNFGQSIILDSPRIMHYPMDIILGVDFIISNFFPITWQSLKKENNYVSLVSNYRDKLMKPYFCSLAGHWKGMLNGTSSWRTEEICPQLFT